MPRSYRYDHFKVPNGGHANPAELEATDKQHVAQTHAEDAKQPAHADASDHGGIHYGHKFAETERLYQAKAHAHAEEPVIPRAQEKAPDARPETAKPSASWMDDIQAILGTVTQHVTHSVALFGHAVKDVRTATGELMHLPIDVAQLTWSRIGAR